MPITDKLVHDLVIVTPTTDGSLDDYGQPEAGDPTETAVSGLVQPKRAREVEQTNESGAMVADHTIFLTPMDLTGAAYIRYDPDDGDRYEIIGIREFIYGTTNDHLEVECRRILSEDLVTVS